MMVKEVERKVGKPENLFTLKCPACGYHIDWYDQKDVVRWWNTKYVNKRLEEDVWYEDRLILSEEIRLSASYGNGKLYYCYSTVKRNYPVGIVDEDLKKVIKSVINFHLPLTGDIKL